MARIPNQSIIGKDGKVLFFSINRFIRDICEGDCCFICGKEYSEEEFDNEHILPDWVLKKYKLHSKTITLANQKDYMYGKYKISCCILCNKLMSEQFETPISKVVAQGYDAVSEYVRNGGYRKIFIWLCLIFLKTHLKDKTFSFHSDRRKGDEKISDGYTWEGFHHIHCVARSFYSGVTINPQVFGSFFVTPVKDTNQEPFDFRDLTFAQTILLRLGEVLFIAVLNDCCASYNVYLNELVKINGYLTAAQSREIMTHFATINLHLKQRPLFYTSVNQMTGEISINAELSPQIELEKVSVSDFGELLYFNVKDLIEATGAPNLKQISEEIKAGKRRFLFNENGEFANHFKNS